MIIPSTDTLLDLTTFIHKENALYEYHMAHIQLVKEYALVLNQRLGSEFDTEKLSFIAYAHDLFKERSLDPSKDVVWNDISIPQDLNRYVRTNIPLLDEHGLGDYFNTDIQLHPLSAGIFLQTQFNIIDKEILFPIFFHSCPIIPVYETLSEKIRGMVDLIMLADKLSSNYLRINMRKIAVRIDLDQAVFGPTGKEFNYTTGLVIARIISQGKSKEPRSLESTDYYYRRLHAINPFIPESRNVKKLGGKSIWPQRNSPVLPTQYHFSKT